MAEFVYKGIDRAGKDVRGHIDAPDQRAAGMQLKQQGVIVTGLSEAGIFNRELNISLGGGKVTAREISVFCRQMYSILDSGVPVVRALYMLADQTENKTFKQAIVTTREHVEKGESLSNSMRQSPKVFPAMLVSLIQAGEESGSLDNSFLRMANHFEKQSKLGDMIKKAMIYPCVVLVVAVVVVIAMSVVVVPQFAEMFDTMGQELPAMTRLIMNISDFFIYKWYIALIVVILVVFAVRYFLQTDYGKHAYARFTMKAPIIGPITVKSAAASFARTMATLVASGMDVPRSLDIVAGSQSNVLIQEALREAKTRVEQGIPLSEPIKDSEVFPPMVGHMLSIGEETGSIDQMLEKVADYYDEEVEAATGALTAAIEPIIIVVLGFIIGFIVLAIYQPMISMYQGMDTM